MKRFTRQESRYKFFWKGNGKGTGGVYSYLRNGLLLSHLIQSRLFLTTIYNLQSQGFQQVKYGTTLGTDILQRRI